MTRGTKIVESRIVAPGTVYRLDVDYWEGYGVGDLLADWGIDKAETRWVIVHAPGEADAVFNLVRKFPNTEGS